MRGAVVSLSSAFIPRSYQVMSPRKIGLRLFYKPVPKYGLKINVVTLYFPQEILLLEARVIRHFLVLILCVLPIYGLWQAG